jgi:FKBP-type peptidyl-prolyl cis-trans isomerase 2
MSTAKKGDTVRLHYTGRLADGQVFDSSRDRQPLEFTLGEGQVIPGFEAAVDGMQPGEEKRVTVPAVDAYGARRDELLLAVPRAQIPDGIDPAPGEQLELSQDGHSFVVTVNEVTDDTVVLDANHPLAGQDLTFELELVEIR